MSEAECIISYRAPSPESISMTEGLILFALTELFFSLSPGPAVFLVVSQSLNHTFREGAATASGIVSLNVVYFILSALGVGAVLVASPAAFTIVKYTGAAYLAWMGGKLIYDIYWASKAEQNESGITENHNSFSNSGKSFLSGVLIQASSPKNIALFIAIIPQFIDPAKDAFYQFFMLCIVSVIIELPVLFGYAFLASKFARRIHDNGYRTILDIISALFLIGIALSLVLAAFKENFVS